MAMTSIKGMVAGSVNFEPSVEDFVRLMFSFYFSNTPLISRPHGVTHVYF